MKVKELGLRRLCSLFPVAIDDGRGFTVANTLFANDDFLHVAFTRNFVHDFEHARFHDRTQATSACIAFQGLFRNLTNSINFKLKFDPIIPK